MIKNYLRVAIRNLLRNRTYSFINIAGLATGLAGFILVSIFIKNELSYDTFNEKADRIYRVVETQDFPGIGKQNVAVTMGPLAPALKNYFSQVEGAVRILPVPPSSCKIGDTGFYEKYISFADPSIFNIFTFPLIEGDPKTALESPYSLVISQSIAGKYFGNLNPLGKTIRLDFGMGPHDYAITGVMKDCPQNSHVYFEMLGSYKSLQNSIPQLKEWGDNWLATYVLLRKGIDYRNVNNSLRGFIDKYVPKASWKELWMYLQPVTDIHLHSDYIPYQTFNHNAGNMSTVELFSVIAIFILLIACINFMNLSTARSAKRTKEIGMRKVLRFHHGRGGQEKIFGELKSQSHMDYIAVRRLSGNQLYLMTAILAHNLTRELQMRTESKTRGTTEKRNPVWHFEQLATLRRHILQRAGRFTRPKGKLTLTITDNPALRRDLLHFLDALKEAA